MPLFWNASLEIVFTVEGITTSVGTARPESKESRVVLPAPDLPMSLLVKGLVANVAF